MKTMKIASWIGAIAVASSLAAVVPALAQTSANVGVNVGAQGGIHNGANGGAWRGGAMPGVFGTVSAINGDTLTVTSNGRPMMRPMPEKASGTPAIAPVAVATTTYTVDATNAKIYKGSATTTVSVSDIALGDTVVVQGAVSGTNITATVIRDGVVPMAGQPGMGGRFDHGSSSTPSGTPPIQGNGEPVIGGSVTNVSGTTITVTNASNVTYTIDAASTTIVKNGTSTAIGNIAIGDNVIVQGAVNGNSVTASSIIDQGVKGTNGSSTNGSSTKPKGGGGFGFDGIFSAIGGFFQHLFGF